MEEPSVPALLEVQRMLDKAGATAGAAAAGHKSH